MISEEKESLKGSDLEKNIEEEVEHSVRMGFIRKVYGIVLVQLLVTAGFIALSLQKAVEEYLTANTWIFWVNLFVLIVVLLVMLVSEKIQREVPYNYIFLFVLTVSISIMVAYETKGVDPSIVRFAALSTAFLVGCLTVYAMFTDTDFTFLGGILACSLGILIIAGFGMFIFGTTHLLYQIYLWMSLIIFSVYLVYDTQLIIGKFGTKFSTDDYSFAAINLYLDIINIFLTILSLARD